MAKQHKARIDKVSRLRVLETFLRMIDQTRKTEEDETPSPDEGSEELENLDAGMKRLLPISHHELKQRGERWKQSREEGRKARS